MPSRDVNPGASKDSASLAIRERTDDKMIFFHGVAEAKAVKNRLHLDLMPDNFDAKLARLHALGATEIATWPHWTTLADPKGNEFDIVRRSPMQTSGYVRLSTIRRSRQVFALVPPDNLA